MFIKVPMPAEGLTNKELNDSSLGRGKGCQALGWVLNKGARKKFG
jgi:hypothetical protein